MRGVVFRIVEYTEVCRAPWQTSKDVKDFDASVDAVGMASIQGACQIGRES